MPEIRALNFPPDGLRLMPDEPGFDRVPDHLPVHRRDRFRQRNILGADLHAILRVVAILD